MGDRRSQPEQAEKLVMMITTTISQPSGWYGILWFAFSALMMLCSLCVSMQNNETLSTKVHLSPKWDEQYMPLPTCADSLARLRDTINSAELITVCKDDFNGSITF